MHPDETDAAPQTPPPPPGSAADNAPTASAAPEPGLSPAECGARLAGLFPALFVAPGAPGPFKPIKLRIHADILARAPGVFSKRMLGIFFSRYTTSNAYLKALAAEGAQRFDLDGQPAGEIADEHRAAAVEELARRHAIAAERRAAQRKAMAPAATPVNAAAPAQDREPRRDDRRERPPRREGMPRSESSPRHDGPPRRERPARAPRHDARPDVRTDARPAPPHRPAGAAPRQVSAPPPSTALPADPAQRERALLLRAFESSPLSKANFCALKRLGEAELDALLAQARAERG